MFWFWVIVAVQLIGMRYMSLLEREAIFQKHRIIIEYWSDGDPCVLICRRFPGLRNSVEEGKITMPKTGMGKVALSFLMRRKVYKNAFKDLFLAVGEFFGMDWRRLLPMNERFWRDYERPILSDYGIPGFFSSIERDKKRMRVFVRRCPARTYRPFRR